MLTPRFTKTLIMVTVIDDYYIHGDDDDWDDTMIDSNILLDGPDQLNGQHQLHEPDCPTAVSVQDSKHHYNVVVMVVVVVVVEVWGGVVT